MADTVSKEMLKTALEELVQSDREFFMALISDTLAYAAASSETALPDQQKQKNRRKPLPVKVIPAYRKGTDAMRREYAVDKSALLALRELFADAPSAEAIIATLTK